MSRSSKRKTGKVCSIPTFDTTSFYNVAFIYGESATGKLLWFKQLPSTMPNMPAGWAGPRNVGSGWDAFRTILPAGGNRFYALAQDGSLLWYEHDGFNDGTFQWKGPVNVGVGWGGFSTIIAGSDGVLYAVQPDGSLLWYRHDGFRDGQGIQTWRGPKYVGTGWDKYKTIFSCGKGILYSVASDGTLWWQAHLGFEDGTNNWSQPHRVGNGWQNFAHVFSAGEGIIYGLQPDGVLLWYKHEQWETGPIYVGGGTKKTVVAARLLNNWQGPIVAAKGWTGYRHILATLPATPVGPS